MLYNVILTTVTWYYSKIKLGDHWKNPIALKLVSAIFLFFSLNDSTSKSMKNAIFSSKNYFFSKDIQIFVFPFSPLFLPVRHCFRERSKIYLKVYDVIICLNKNLITHFI